MRMGSMTDVVMGAAARSPFGKLGGGLSALPAVELGAAVIREVLTPTGTAPGEVDQLIMDTVVDAGRARCPLPPGGCSAEDPKKLFNTRLRATPFVPSTSTKVRLSVGRS
jgi:acetyl-CoA C-acetyltransferase